MSDLTKDQFSAGDPEKKLYATWDISLNTECPKCEEYFDISERDDFWSDGLEPIEHGTDRTRDFEVVCPKCDHEFVVDLEY